MRKSGLKLVIFWILLMVNKNKGFRCDRRPLGSPFHVSPSDGRFQLIVEGAEDNTYTPDQVYIVKIVSTDDDSQFMGFMISAEGDSKTDPLNPRRVTPLVPGEMKPMNPTLAKYSDRCPYSVEHTMNSLKSSAEVYWQAPPTGNGCVTIRAMVVENDELWFEDGEPLTTKICEDLKQPDDVTPEEISECNVCDEAKYEVSFTGIWSRNTHPRLFPENDWMPKYSDMVGASHSSDFTLWCAGSLASAGLKELAEYTKTDKIEEEIRERIGDGVRTMIKGKGHGYRKMSEPTFSFFRTNKDNHLVSIAVGMHPSPDWFMGVSKYDLCHDDEWISEKELNLFPWDAGTDSGVSYEASNIPMIPQEPINRVQMSSVNPDSPFFEMDMKEMNPFGTLKFTLIRTYHRECEEAAESPTEETPENEDEENTNDTDTDQSETEDKKENDEESEPENPSAPSRYQNPETDTSDLVGTIKPKEPSIKLDPESSEECPMTEWTDWSPCEGSCEDDKIKGYKWRERYHLVNGIAVEKYEPNGRRIHKKPVSKYCKENFDDFERVDCEEDCPEPESQEETAERRVSGHKKYGSFSY